MNVVAVVGRFMVIAASVDMSHDHCDETFQQSCDCVTPNAGLRNLTESNGKCLELC